MLVRRLPTVLAMLLVACSSSSGADPKNNDAAATDATGAAATATATPTADATAQPEPSTAQTTSPATGSAQASSAPAKAPAGPAKEPGALVLTLAFSMKAGGKVDPTTTAELIQAAEERIATSSKLATSAGKIDKPRALGVTVLLTEPKNDAKGLTVRMGFVGVEPDGKCPVFDIDQSFTLSDTKTAKPEDVLALRRSAIQALLGKLESESGNLKPKANCTAFKKP